MFFPLTAMPQTLQYATKMDSTGTQYSVDGIHSNLFIISFLFGNFICFIFHHINKVVMISFVHISSRLQQNDRVDFQK